MENPTPTVLRILMARLKKYQDSDGQVFKTIDELLTGIQDDSAEGAMSYLVSTGVVERTKPTTKVVQIAINEDEFDKLTPKQQALIAAVKDGGVEVDVTRAGNKVYSVDLAYLAAKTNVLPGTVSTTLKKLDKAGFITYVPPFTGKITKILRELTQEDMENAQKRRDREWSKVCDARAYSTVADDKKQQFITEYFSREL
jgi:DNA-binding MarR family transcriptional regulator